MGKRTEFAPKHKIFNHRQYTLYPRYCNTKRAARELADQLRVDQVVMGVRFITDVRVAQFGSKWVVYTWENRYYSKKNRKMMMRR